MIWREANIPAMSRRLLKFCTKCLVVSSDQRWPKELIKLDDETVMHPQIRIQAAAHTQWEHSIGHTQSTRTRDLNRTLVHGCVVSIQ